MDSQKQSGDLVNLLGKIILRSKRALGATDVDVDEVFNQAEEWAACINPAIPHEEIENCYLHIMRTRQRHNNISITEINAAWVEVGRGKQKPVVQAECLGCTAEADGVPEGYECPFHGQKAKVRYGNFNRVQ